MKKILVSTSILLLFTVMLRAQNTSFGFHAGTSIAKLTYKEDNVSYIMDNLFSVQAGFVADLPLGKRISLQPGLNFIQKGGKVSEEYGGSTEEQIMRLNSIEVPINVLFNTRGEKGNFFIGAGPAISFGISGKAIYKSDGVEEKEKLKIGNNEDEDDIRGMDLGINALAGYQFRSGIFIGASYNIGLRNLVPGGDSDFGSGKSSYYGFRIGYMFGNK
jgi:hypothetical protein